MRLAILFALMTLAGCAIGNEYDYRAASAPVPASSAETLAVAVTDHRPYVLSGDKSPDFVGLQRAGFGIPYNVTTASGAPLADDLSVLLANSFAAAGTEVEIIRLPNGASADAALEQFKGTAADRFLLIEMLEWKSDHYAQVTIHWNLVGQVYDRSGRLLGEDRIQGTRGTGEGFWSLEAGKNRIVTAEAKRLFGELLARPSIAGALG
ncbi:hypothetical protein M1105_05450 [Limibaculum sp. FT325]|uniref:hypothetical protein n=1 Tax=Thermohalobaculum sediminis TaxID=2939436 RepID=UPI0020BE4720|nr:hypothetical protein [Limibaculum sediminis]MCL5776433.1 hypothetical protein [Limibaculum sediminis]